MTQAWRARPYTRSCRYGMRANSRWGIGFGRYFQSDSPSRLSSERLVEIWLLTQRVSWKQVSPEPVGGKQKRLFFFFLFFLKTYEDFSVHNSYQTPGRRGPGLAREGRTAAGSAWPGGALQFQHQQGRAGEGVKNPTGLARTMYHMEKIIKRSCPPPPPITELLALADAAAIKDQTIVHGHNTSSRPFLPPFTIAADEAG